MSFRFSTLTIAFILLYSIITKAQLEEHIIQGKQSYIENADIKEHQKLKALKDIQSHNVGDSKTFWRWNLSVMPPQWVQETATCRAVGNSSYVFVADSEWGSGMTQNDVDTVLDYLENRTLNDTTIGIVDMDALYFGNIPDELDGDPKVIFYFTALGSYAGSIFDGYFSAFNQMTEAEAQISGDHSNECEMLYMSCNPVDPSAYSTLSVLAHELEHLIHFGYDPYEETWVDEGCAEFAMVLFGHPDPISSFPQNSDDNLIDWGQDFIDYVQTMLFFTYMAEQTTGPAVITQIVANNLTGIAGIENVLTSINFPLNFQEIFANWAVANYVDDTSIYNGQYGYELLDLPVFSYEYYFSSYPVSDIGLLNSCATYYYKLSTNFSSIHIEFDFTQGTDWDQFLITYDSSGVNEVIPFSGSTMNFNHPSYTLSKLVLVVVNSENSVGSNQYSLTINEYNGIEENTNGLTISGYPNPAINNFNIQLDKLKNKKYSIIFNDITGKFIKEIPINNRTQLSIDISDLEKGSYLYTLYEDGYPISTKKFSILR